MRGEDTDRKMAVSCVNHIVHDPRLSLTHGQRPYIHVEQIQNATFTYARTSGFARQCNHNSIHRYSPQAYEQTAGSEATHRPRFKSTSQIQNESCQIRKTNNEQAKWRTSAWCRCCWCADQINYMLLAHENDNKHKYTVNKGWFPTKAKSRVKIKWSHLQYATNISFNGSRINTAYITPWIKKKTKFTLNPAEFCNFDKTYYRNDHIQSWQHTAR